MVPAVTAIVFPERGRLRPPLATHEGEFTGGIVELDWSTTEAMSARGLTFLIFSMSSLASSSCHAGYETFAYREQSRRRQQERWGLVGSGGVVGYDAYHAYGLALNVP